MRTRLLPQTLVVLSIFVVGTSVPAGQQKPVVVRQFHTDGGTQPKTLDEIWQLSSLIVEATVTGQRPADVHIKVPDEPPITRVRTAYRLDLNEVFKDTSQGLPRTIELLLLGGERDRGDRVVIESDTRFPAPKVGDRYILFLQKTETSGEYVLATSTEDSAVLITATETRPLGRSEVAKEFAKQPPGQLKSLLRAHKGRAK